MSNEILKVGNTCAFSWLTTASATKYHFRISRYFDFSIVDHENTNIATTVYTAVLTKGNSKYYYQWRHYAMTWQKWNEVQAFEKITGGADLTITNGKWLMFESSERATYTLQFENAPHYTYSESQIYRTQERNLAGDILSEFWTTKGKINVEFGENNTISATEKTQIIRYFGMNSGDVYLACAPFNGTGYYRKLWKVWFTEEPIVRPLDGREDRFLMSLVLEER